jgi:hypothetical protein
MKKTLAALLAATTVVVMAGTATDAFAQWRGRGGGWHGGWGWRGPAVAAGVVGGAIVAGAIIASRPSGYVVYEGYGQPVYGPGCYWASQPVYDPMGRVVGYSGQPVQVCPGYAPPPAAAPGYAGGPPPAAVAPGYAGGPPPGAAPGYAGGPPPGNAPDYAGGPGQGNSAAAYCAQRFRSYDPRSGTYLGTDGLRHPCP